MVQQYQTADGSIWETTNEDDHYLVRVDSPDGSHDDDAHSQHLSKVIRHWGALTLYDQKKVSGDILAVALLGMAYDTDVKVFGPRIAQELDYMGYEIKKKDQ